MPTPAQAAIYGGNAWNPYILPDLAARYDLSKVASTTSDFIRIDSSNRVSLLADTSGNSATNGLVLTGTSSNYASAPDSAALSITGDIDIRVRMAMADWTPSGNQCPISKYTAAGTRSYILEMRTDGKPEFSWSADGTAVITKTSTAAPTVSDYATLWIRVTLDVDDGAGNNVVTYYTSTDGATWSPLGTPVTTVGTTSIHDNTANLNVGSYNNGAASPFNGVIYRAQIYNGIAGTLAFDANFTAAAKLAASFTESSSNAATVTINTSGATGARICGARDLYQGTTASQPIYLQWAGTNYGYLRGASGTYFSTPSAAAIAITGDLDLRVFLAMNNWSPASAQSLLSKWNDTGNQRGYLLKIDTAGKLQLFLSTTGSNFPSATSTSAVGGTNYASTWVRATWVKSSGLVTFYKSADGSNWSSLGTATLNANTAIYDTTASVEVGGDTSGSNPAAGTVYRAQIYSGIDGTLAFDFNPATYTSGTTFTDSSSNGATITLNGGSTIVTRTCLYFDGSDDYMKAASFSLSQPESVYFTGQQVSWTANDVIYDGNLNDGLQLYQQTATPRITMYAGSVGSTTTELAIRTQGVISSVFNGASSVIRVNRGAPNIVATGSNNGNGFTLGAAGTSAAGPGNITTNEILIYSAAHDTSTGDRVALYEGRKWRIAGV